MLNKVLLYTCVFLFSFNSYSQKEGWLIGHVKVIEQAEKENKPIMVNFTGSDWCGWCKKLDKDVFQTNEFKKWAKENVILLEIDNPRRTTLAKIYGLSEEEGKNLKNQNDYFQNQFQVRGFPTIWIFSVSKTEDGKFSINASLSNQWQRMGYMQSSTAFISKAESIIEQMETEYK